MTDQPKSFNDTSLKAAQLASTLRQFARHFPKLTHTQQLGSDQPYRWSLTELADRVSAIHTVLAIIGETPNGYLNQEALDGLRDEFKPAIEFLESPWAVETLPAITAVHRTLDGEAVILEPTSVQTGLDLCTPWSLHFDRDGTEDYGFICDAQGNDMVASHLPSSKVARIADRPFGTGCFWLPENEGDEMPLLVLQMQLMTLAPKLFAACKLALAVLENAMEDEDPQARTQIEWEGEPMATLRAVIAEATGKERQLAE